MKFDLRTVFFFFIPFIKRFIDYRLYRLRLRVERVQRNKFSIYTTETIVCTLTFSYTFLFNLCGSHWALLETIYLLLLSEKNVRKLLSGKKLRDEIVISCRTNKNCTLTQHAMYVKCTAVNAHTRTRFYLYTRVHNNVYSHAYFSLSMTISIKYTYFVVRAFF